MKTLVAESDNSSETPIDLSESHVAANDNSLFRNFTYGFEVGPRLGIDTEDDLEVIVESAA